MRKFWLLPAVIASLLSGCSSTSHPATAGESSARAAAAADFDRAKDPAVRPETFFASARFAESQGDAARAIGQYQQAVKVKPDFAPALYRLGVLQSQVKNYPAAIAAWQGYVKATGESAGAYSDLAFCYQLASQDADAANAYLKGIARDPKNRSVRTNYGLLLTKQGKDAEAIEQWSAVLSPAEVQYNLASVYEQRGDRTKARDAYRQALKLDPKLGDATKRLAELDKD